MVVAVVMPALAQAHLAIKTQARAAIRPSTAEVKRVLVTAMSAPIKRLAQLLHHQINRLQLPHQMMKARANEVSRKEFDGRHPATVAAVLLAQTPESMRIVKTFSALVPLRRPETAAA